jgi:anti-sigma factor ChrR (cupin superfamily)
MAIADVHPDIADLEAFALGKLDEGSLAGVEAHVAGCPTCQELAANACGDTLVELLCPVHVQAVRQKDNLAEAAAKLPTPAPVPSPTEALTQLAAAPAGVDETEAGDHIPLELARHERYRIVRSSIVISKG